MSAPGLAALAASTHALVPAGPDVWRFTACVGSATELTGEAALDGDWLTLTVAAEDNRAAVDDWGVLERNARLPGGVRLVPLGARRGLRVDVPLAAGADVATPVHTAIAALAAAVAEAEPDPVTIPPAPLVVPDAHAASPLVAPLRFASVPRGADRWAVDLGVPDFASRAVVMRAANATLTIGVALVEDLATPPTAVGRLAVGRLLARVATSVRLARPAVDAGAPASLRFEVLGLRPDAAAVDEACGALAAACHLAAVETAALLSDDALAHRYLALDTAAAIARAA